MEVLYTAVAFKQLTPVCSMPPDSDKGAMLSDLHSSLEVGSMQESAESIYGVPRLA